MLTDLIPAQDLAIPPCPHFGPCGGCQLQHLTYAAQLALKAAQLRALLEAANLTFPELQIHASPPLAYRNRIRLTLAEVDGQLRAGYIRNPASPAEPAAAFLPINECPIAAPILWRATAAFLALINEAPANWLRNPHQIPDQLELFTAADESALQLTLYIRTAAKALPPKFAAAFTALCEALRESIPELTGAGVALFPTLSKQRSRRAEQSRPGPTWGGTGLHYRVPMQDEISALSAASQTVILSAAKNPRIASLPLPVPQPATDNRQPATTFWVPRGAFFQINRFLLPELLALVASNRAGQLAWDLYAGVGLFSRVLARSFEQVTAVEIAEPAASALSFTKLANLRAVSATTLDFLRAAVVQRERPDLIVLDPPRTGAGPEVCALLARIAAPMLIYVSCSPETLPEDLAILSASGYTIDELHLLDLFPQTTHIETIAILTRRDHPATTSATSVVQS
jgi:23S rRNA (uracil1939-C5)-methyltransferase